MSWLICGTLPEETDELLFARATTHHGRLLLHKLPVSSACQPCTAHSPVDRVDAVGQATHSIPKADMTAADIQSGVAAEAVPARAVPVLRGTAALIQAFCLTAQHYGIDQPFVLLGADTGDGNGSRKVYAWLENNLAHHAFDGITFHYLLPDIDWQLKILSVSQGLQKRPCLIADAGYMYAAKMGGYANEFDLFTPDAGELAFLADELAPHPFYTRGFLLSDERQTPELVKKAVQTNGAAKNMLVKGRTDVIMEEGTITATVDSPCVEALEAVGGTGDTLTGIVSALFAAGLPAGEACTKAAKANRTMGLLANPDPATQIADILAFLPEALKTIAPTQHCNT